MKGVINRYFSSEKLRNYFCSYISEFIVVFLLSIDHKLLRVIIEMKKTSIRMILKPSEKEEIRRIARRRLKIQSLLFQKSKIA